MSQNEYTTGSSDIKILNCSAEEIEDAVKDYSLSVGSGNNSKCLNDTINNSANGNYSLAGGFRTTADNNFASAFGVGTITSAEAQTVIGKYNAKNDDAIFIVGNGTTEAGEDEINLIASPDLYEINYIKIENDVVSIGQNTDFIGQDKFDRITDGDTVENTTIPCYNNGKIGLLFQFTKPCYIDHAVIYGGVAGYIGYTDIYSLYAFDEFTDDCIKNENIIDSSIICDGELDGVSVEVNKATRYIALIMENEAGKTSRIREIKAYGTPLNYSNAFTVNADGSACFSGDVYAGAEENKLAYECDTNQTYQPDSIYPQSGKAVAQAVEESSAEINEQIDSMAVQVTTLDGRVTALENGETSSPEAGENTYTKGQIDAKFVTVNQAISSNTQTIASQSSELNNVKSDLTAAESNIDSLQDGLTSVQNDISSLQTNTGLTNTYVSGINGKVTGLESDMTEAKNDIDNLQSNMSTAQGLITNLQTKINTAEENITQIQSDLDSAETSITGIKEKFVGGLNGFNSAVSLSGNFNYLSQISWYTHNMSSYDFLANTPNHSFFTVIVNPDNTFSDIPTTSFYGVALVIKGSGNYANMIIISAGGSTIYTCSKIVEGTTVTWRKLGLSNI